jgi:hypothetical protein
MQKTSEFAPAVSTLDPSKPLITSADHAEEMAKKIHGEDDGTPLVQEANPFGA